MSSVDIKELFESGAHFGHKTSRWHPKMAPYIHSVKGDQHIINLDQTVAMLGEALAAIEDVTSRGKQVLFVGTKRQARDSIVKAATETGQPYVSVRWMGGMLTNNKTINNRIKHLKKLEERMESGDLKNRYNKLEVQRFQEEIDDLNHNFGGIKNMNGLPGAVVITDLLNESIAVKEARRLNIPIIAIADSNTDPSGIDYPIPANDDSIKATELILSYMISAVAKGKLKHKQAPAKKPASPVKIPQAKPSAPRTATSKAPDKKTSPKTKTETKKEVKKPAKKAEKSKKEDK